MNMLATNEIKTFERKNGTVSMRALGAQYVITTAQRIRADLVWATETVRPTIAEALVIFSNHKQTILNNRHCVGDNTHLR